MYVIIPKGEDRAVGPFATYREACDYANDHWKEVGACIIIPLYRDR